MDHAATEKAALDDVLMIGVSGMRGTIGGSLTPLVVSRMAAAFAAFLKQTSKSGGGAALKVVFGRDSRPSGTWVRDAAAAALTACGVEVVDLEIVTTPGVAMMVRHLGADGGMIATASHNPIEWNGLKVLNRQGIAPPAADAGKIAELYHSGAAAWSRVENLVPSKKNSETHALHVKRVLDYVDVLGISSKRYRVVLDSVNGAGCVATATMLGKLGCELIHINNVPDGKFPHEPEPTEKNLVGLCGEVRKHRAAVGFAQDPDADRLAIVDENGKYIGEEYSLALAAKWMFSKSGKGAVAATNLSTSRMLDDIAAAHGGRVIRTPVGEANVVQAMLEHKALIGGEGNGGVIDPRIVPGRDSLVGMAYVLQLMAGTGLALNQLVGQIPHYDIVKSKFPCRREDAQRAVEALKGHYKSQKVDIQDGIRIDWPDAWVHARASNTEPIMRIISEAPTRAAADNLLAEVQKVVNAALGQ